MRQKQNVTVETESKGEAQRAENRKEKTRAENKKAFASASKECVTEHG